MQQLRLGRNWPSPVKEKESSPGHMTRRSYKFLEQAIENSVSSHPIPTVGLSIVLSIILSITFLSWLDRIIDSIILSITFINCRFATFLFLFLFLLLFLFFLSTLCLLCLLLFFLSYLLQLRGLTSSYSFFYFLITIHLYP